MGPLYGQRVLEFADGPAAGFAGLLMRMLGATVDMLEPNGSSALRSAPPQHEGVSMLYAYLAAGKNSKTPAEINAAYLANVNIVVHDAKLPSTIKLLMDAARHPTGGRVVISCTPYGSTGPKSRWQATELSLFQSGGEGYLMPHGLPYEEHPERPPIGIGRYSAHYQGGIATALGAVAALRKSRASGKNEHIDVSVQDAQLSLNYFTVSRYVDGVRESRATRAFRYAGILRCADGWVELVPLENHHWAGVLSLLGHPPELMTSEYEDLITRANHGDTINVHLRKWASTRKVAEVVALSTKANIPCGPYLSPAVLAEDKQLAHRGYFVSDKAHPQRGDLFPGPAWNLDRWERPKLGRADAQLKSKEKKEARDAST